jgi:enterochelin esterase family protein
MSGYVQPWEITYKPNIKHGTLIEDTIKSQIVNRTYKLKIFIPVEYFYLPAPLPTVYFQDGEDYLNLGYAKNVIDNILDSGKVVPFIGVFVQPNDRNEEYAYSLRNLYSRFFVEELVPYIDKTFRTIKNPAQRLVLGDSFGGNISALIAFNSPDVFGNCGQQSGAFWPNDYEVQKLFLNNPKKNIKMFSVWGTYESLFSDWRPLRDNMISKGYQLQWKEYHEGHSWGQWRATLDDLLTYFFPKSVTAVKIQNSSFPSAPHLEQNYPNPFNPETIIKYSISFANNVQLKVYDLLGREITTLVNQYQLPGNYAVSFNSGNLLLPSGVYYCSLTSGNYSKSMKMVYLK